MRKLITIFALLIAIVLATSSIGSRSGQAAKTEGERVSLPTPDTSKLAGFDIANMDKSVSACSNFFQYANGGWIARNPVPPAFSRWGRFEVLDEGNLEVLHGILDSMVKGKGLRRGANEKKIADFYGSCMDEAGIEAEGAKPLQAELDRIASIKDVSGLQAEIARFHSYRIPAVFGFGAGQDFKNSQAVIAQAVQGGLNVFDSTTAILN